MRRFAPTLALLWLGLVGCEAPGLPGDLERAGFSTGRYCAVDCRHLRGHVVGGRYAVRVSMLPEDCPSEPWTVSAEGAASSFTPDDPDEDGRVCGGTVSFEAREVGSVRLTITTEAGGTVDTIALSVREPERFTITWDSADAAWTPIDPERVVVPAGAYVFLRPVAVGGGAPLAVDPDLVAWEIAAGDVLEAADDHPLTDPALGNVYAARPGVGRVDATLRGLEASLELEVRPMEEFAPTHPFCEGTDVCDGVDNDCDGEVDEEGSLGCWLGDASHVCAAGRCVDSGCTETTRDCEGGDGVCETDVTTTEDCGGCGITCAADEVCREGSCIPTP